MIVRGPTFAVSYVSILWLCFVFVFLFALGGLPDSFVAQWRHAIRIRTNGWQMTISLANNMDMVHLIGRSCAPNPNPVWITSLEAFP